MSGLDSYKARFDEQMLPVFESAVLTARTSGLNRLSPAGLINALLAHCPDFFESIFQSLGVQQDRFLELLNKKVTSGEAHTGGGSRLDQAGAKNVRHGSATAG